MEGQGIFGIFFYMWQIQYLLILIISLFLLVQCLQAVLLLISINFPIFQYFACFFSIYQ